MQTRTLLAVTAILLVSACSSTKTIEATPERVQEMIITENVLAPGDQVRIVTSDGKIHEFRVVVVEVDSRLIRGKDSVVNIDDIVAVETKELSLGKTALFAGGTYLFAVAMVALAVASLL